MTRKLLAFFGFIAVQVINGHNYTVIREEILRKGCYDNICWNNHSYPMAEINEKLHNDLSFLQTVGHVDHPEIFVEPIKSCKMCNSMINIKVKPLSIVDEGKQYIIINGNKYKETEIILNVCGGHQGESHCMSQTALPYNFATECKQKRTKMNVLVYDVKKNEFDGKSFSYPSACECILRHIL
nr:uncharacterized protein LOC111512352 [Leptinotarsa decemlineata]